MTPPSPPFSKFPKIHPFWRKEASLRMIPNHTILNCKFMSGLEDQDTVDLLQLIRQITWRAQDEEINSGGMLKDKSKDKLHQHSFSSSF